MTIRFTGRSFPAVARKKDPSRERFWASVFLAAAAGVASLPAHPSTSIDRGRALADDYTKGNCFACHSAPGDGKIVTRANIAPPLARMRERFPDREQLRRQIWDPMVRNPETVMPPFGKHRILSEQEIELIIDYLYTL